MGVAEALMDNGVALAAAPAIGTSAGEARAPSVSVVVCELPRLRPLRGGRPPFGHHAEGGFYVRSSRTTDGTNHGSRDAELGLANPAGDLWLIRPNAAVAALARRLDQLFDRSRAMACYPVAYEQGRKIRQQWLDGDGPA